METIFDLIRQGKMKLPETPSLVVDGGIMRDNIARMQQGVSACGCALRPHIKTHKIPYFTNLQLQAGAQGITCAKVSEAEVMVNGGAQDIFIAYPMVGDFRVKRALALQKRMRRLILAVDSLEGARALNDAAKEQGMACEVRLEVDTGAARTGASRERCVEMGAEINKLENLRLTGIYTFKSLILEGAPTQDAQSAALEEARLMDETGKALRAAGVDIRDISIGSTPTGLLAAQTGLATEVRPGTYIFNDWMVMKEGCAQFSQIAVRLYCTVVSTPRPDLAVIDGGVKTFPMDAPVNAPPYYYPGYAVVLNKEGQPQENLVLRRMAEEHGMVTAANGETGLKVGQLLELVPIHVCPAVNLQNKLFLYERGKLTTLPVAARGMLV